MFFAIEGIVEIYEQQGRRRDAIPHLRDVLERHSGNPTVRTITRFKLRDLYKETGQPDLALEELDTIIDEIAESQGAREDSPSLRAAPDA